MEINFIQISMKLELEGLANKLSPDELIAAIIQLAKHRGIFLFESRGSC